MRVACAALLVALVVACGEAPDARPSVLLVTIDTLRGDVVGPRGHGPSLTPRLDALAARGTRFAHATTVTPLTLPTHASILTALRPARHGLTVNGVTSDAFPTPLLTARLAEVGYATAAFVSSTVLDRAYGLADAFDHYDDDLAVSGGPLAPTERRGDRTVDRALAWLDDAQTPWFVWVHLFDPHAPYEAPGGPRGEGRDAYHAEVAFADRQLGRLLDGLDPERATLVVATSDHGEGLGDHDEQTHGLLLYESTVAVPLDVAWWGAAPTGAPLAAAGVVRDDLASVLDVAPTVLDVLGLDVPGGLDGVSLAAPLPPARIAPLETRAPWFYYGASSLAGARRGVDKVVGAVDAVDPRYERTDVEADPAEASPRVVGPDDELAAAVASPAPEREAQAIADRDMLLELGYLSADAPVTDDGTPRPDPRDLAPMLAVLDRANTAIVSGEPLRAIAILHELPKRRRDVSEVLYLRGRAERAAGRPDRAVDALAEAAVRQPGSAGVLLELSRAWLSVADDARALARLDVARGDDVDRTAALAASCRAAEAMLALVPGDPEGVAQWALATWRAGDASAALAQVDEALAERPRHVALLTVALRILDERGDGRADEVRAALRRVAPDHPLLR